MLLNYVICISNHVYSFVIESFILFYFFRTAFSFWILANIMICSVVFYGGILFTLTGITMTTTSIVYHILQPTTQLRLFCSESEFHLHYGICFWAVLFMGMLLLVKLRFSSLRVTLVNLGYSV